MRFKGQTLFQQKEDASDDKKQEGREKMRRSNLWNGPDDCGIAFQKGGTYLVYATDDEESKRAGTNVCLRSARVSDAGEDLAYLDYFQRGPDQAIRLVGFVTSEVQQLNRDPSSLHQSWSACCERHHRTVVGKQHALYRRGRKR
jgi:hypothetical protein